MPSNSKGFCVLLSSPHLCWGELKTPLGVASTLRGVTKAAILHGIHKANFLFDSLSDSANLRTPQSMAPASLSRHTVELDQNQSSFD